MDKKIDIHKSAGVLIVDRKFLVTRSKGKSFFIAPGGKVEQGESVQEALIRELKEEISINIDLKDLTMFGTFFAPAAGHTDKYLQMDVFLVETWKGEIKPSSEVEEIKWINSLVANDIELGSIFHHEVLPKLKKLGLID